MILTKSINTFYIIIPPEIHTVRITYRLYIKKIINKLRIASLILKFIQYN